MRWRTISWTIAPQQLRAMLVLPGEGSARLRISGPAAERYFARLTRALLIDDRSLELAHSLPGELHLNDPLVKSAHHFRLRFGKQCARSVVSVGDIEVELHELIFMKEPSLRIRPHARAR